MREVSSITRKGYVPFRKYPKSRAYRPRETPRRRTGAKKQRGWAGGWINGYWIPIVAFAEPFPLFPSILYELFLLPPPKLHLVVLSGVVPTNRDSPRSRGPPLPLTLLLSSAFGEPRAPAYWQFGRPALAFMVGSGAVSSLLGCEGERIASGHEHVQLRVRAALCILDVRQGLQSGPRLIDF